MKGDRPGGPLPGLRAEVAAAQPQQVRRRCPGGRIRWPAGIPRQTSEAPRAHRACRGRPARKAWTAAAERCRTRVGRSTAPTSPSRARVRTRGPAARQDRHAADRAERIRPMASRRRRSLVPGAGIPTALADVMVFTEASVLYTLSLAEVHDLHPDDFERWKLLVLTVLLGDGAVKALDKAVGRTGPYWGRRIVGAIPMSAINRVNKVLGPRFVTKYGSKQGVLVLGKQVPLGIGAALGADGNHVFGRLTIGAARAIFGPPRRAGSARTTGTRHPSVPTSRIRRRIASLQMGGPGSPGPAAGGEAQCAAADHRDDTLSDQRQALTSGALLTQPGSCPRQRASRRPDQAGTRAAVTAVEEVRGTRHAGRQKRREGEGESRRTGGRQEGRCEERAEEDLGEDHADSESPPPFQTSPTA